MARGATKGPKASQNNSPDAVKKRKQTAGKAEKQKADKAKRQRVSRSAAAAAVQADEPAENADALSIFQPLSISFSTRMCAFPVLLHVCGSLRSSDDDSGDDEGRKTSEQPEAAAKGASKQKGRTAAATKDEPAPTAKGAAFTPSSL